MCIIKDIDNYKTRMNVTMTLDEKLFFLNHLDLQAYTCIVDFGGADGTLLYHIQQKYPNLTDTCLFVIVDKNPQMEMVNTLKNCIRVETLDDICPRITKERYKVLFICSSVLHECTSDDMTDVALFCHWYADTIVMRDMAYTSESGYSKVSLSEQDFSSMAAYQTITRDRKLHKQFKEMLKYINEWHQDVYKALTHFILKCEYTTNWDSEIKENYFNNNIVWLSAMLEDEGYERVYKRLYTLPYKAKQASVEFKFGLPKTHMQVILRKPRPCNENELVKGDE